MSVAALRCRICEHVAPPASAASCPRCGGPTDVAYDLDTVARVVSRRRIAGAPRMLVRYGDLLPAPVDRTRAAVGSTPLVRLGELSAALEIDLWAKLETANPTRSYKDRTAALAGAAAAALGVDTICCTSTGALGRAVAAEAAARGLEALVLAPAGTGAAARALGAHVVEVDAPRSACHELERELATLFPWGFVDGNLRPYAAEGPKTVSFEIAEQLAWRAPDVVVCAVSSGTLLAKVAQGFHELRAVGLLRDHPPRLIGAQVGFTPVAAAFAADATVRSRRSSFVELALGAARSSGGAIVPVTAAEARHHGELLASQTGVEVDFAGGAALGGLAHALRSGRIRRGERVVLVVSGGIADVGPGDADVAAAPVAPELDAVLASLGVR